MRLLSKSAIGHLDAQQLARLTKGIDIVGDIAILKITNELEDKKHLIAESLLDLAPNLRVVLEQIAPVSSRFRTRKLKWLAGEERTETVHSEFGCRYRVDLETTYFSPRLSRERKRIADLVSSGECVVNFFAGIGSFSIMIARHSYPSRIFSLDINPAAVRYHAINDVLNGVQDTIDVICGDANRLVAASLVGCADRVLLPLPDLALMSLPIAKSTLRNERGTVHCYVFVDSNRRSEAGKQALSEIGSALEQLGTTGVRVEAHVVRSVGPCLYQVCLDIFL
jgi:tRNA (guanine37-N1)-methyltransferase